MQRDTKCIGGVLPQSGSAKFTRLIKGVSRWVVTLDTHSEREGERENVRYCDVSHAGAVHSPIARTR